MVLKLVHVIMCFYVISRELIAFIITVWRIVHTSPYLASSITIRTGKSEQIPISLIMCGWSNWRIISEMNMKNVSMCGILRKLHCDLNLKKTTLRCKMGTSETLTRFFEEFLSHWLLVVNLTSFDSNCDLTAILKDNTTCSRWVTHPVHKNEGSHVLLITVHSTSWLLCNIVLKWSRIQYLAKLDATHKVSDIQDSLPISPDFNTDCNSNYPRR